MRIIGGRYKNYTIPIAKNALYRPSTNKFKEALFSILTSGEFKSLMLLENAIVLDVFAGACALGFEALSRGAKCATFIDINSRYINTAKTFIEKYKIEKEVSFICANALFLSVSHKKHNLVFLDPPYNQTDTVNKTISSLISKGWVSNGAFFVLEISRKSNFFYKNSNLSLVLDRIYGNSKLIILQYGDALL